MGYLRFERTQKIYSFAVSSITCDHLDIDTKVEILENSFYTVMVR